MTRTIDTGTADLLAELHDDGVLVATLNRPDTRNAFSGAMGRALGDIYRMADTDDAVRVVVLTGTPPAFCAGADFSNGSDVFERSLTLHCDLRFMAHDAKYGIVQVRRGVMPDAMSHWTLPRLVGLANAADILLTGRTFTGAEARDLGVASRVLPNDDVLPHALEVAHDMAVNTAPLSVAVSKRLLWGTFAMTPDEVDRAETDLHHHLMGEADAREGVMAFLERRDPQWSLTVNDNWPSEWPTPGDIT